MNTSIYESVALFPPTPLDLGFGAIDPANISAQHRIFSLARRRAGISQFQCEGGKDSPRM
jgi:hypothetical protein